MYSLHLRQRKVLFLSYQRKGYRSPNDVNKMFEAFGKKVKLNVIENSFKYAKVHKNKMIFEDFKDFYNLWKKEKKNLNKGKKIKLFLKK